MSKGYGFLSCDSKKTYNRILETRNHEIKGRMVEINKALNKNSAIPSDIRSKGLRKLFVGGLAQKTEQVDLETYFSAFGEVLTSYLIYDPNTKLSKNFGYVEFKTVESAQAVLSWSEHVINGKAITVENQKNGVNACQQLQLRHTLQATKKKEKFKNETSQSSASINYNNVELQLSKMTDELANSAVLHMDPAFKDSFADKSDFVEAAFSKKPRVQLIEGISQMSRPHVVKRDVSRSTGCVRNLVEKKRSQKDFYEHLKFLSEKTLWKDHCDQNHNLVFRCKGAFNHDQPRNRVSLR